MSGNSDLFCHTGAGNGDSGMGCWLGCWKTRGWEGEILRTLVSPDLLVLMLLSLAGPLVPWPPCIFTRCEYSQIVFFHWDLGKAHSYILQTSVSGASLCHWMTYGEKLSFFCSVYFSQNDSFLISFLPNAYFCNHRKDASIYWLHISNWLLLLLKTLLVFFQVPLF